MAMEFNRMQVKVAGNIYDFTKESDGSITLYTFYARKVIPSSIKAKIGEPLRFTEIISDSGMSTHKTQTSDRIESIKYDDECEKVDYNNECKS